MRLRLALPLLLTACGGPEPTTVPSTQPTPTSPIPGAVGPMPRGIVPALIGFDREVFFDNGASPVVAVTPDDQKHHAIIDPVTGWPAIGRGYDPMVPLADAPGRSGRAESIAMVASADGMLHAVWVAGEDVFYAAIKPAGYQTVPEVVVRGAAFDPTIAIKPNGSVVIAYTTGESTERPARIGIAVIEQRDGQFGGVQLINPDCCLDDGGNLADTISGPSLAVGPNGEVHVVYEWMTFGQTTIDYVTESNLGWTAPLRIADVAFSPCPALSVDSAGAHITYLLEGNRNVWYRRVVDGEVSEAESLYESEHFIQMALMIQDAAGVMHVIVDERRTSGTTFVYVRDDKPDAIPISIEGSFSTNLTPFAGGAAISSRGDLYFTLGSNDTRCGPGQAEVVFGRRAGQD